MPNLLKNSLLLIVSLAVTIVVCDGIFRLYENWVLTPSRGIYSDSVNLEELNYNDVSVPRSKTDKNFRVLSFGDSFAYTITKYPYSYHGVASELINSAQALKKARILNLGEPAVSFFQYRRGYKFFSELIEYDAVVFNIYLGNDLLDVSYKYVPDDADINRLFGELDYNLQTGNAMKRRVPEKYPLRMLDYAYAYSLMWGGEIGEARDTGKGAYNLALAELNTDTYLQTVQIQMDNFHASKLKDLKAGYKAAIDFFRFVSELRQSGIKVVVMIAPNEGQIETELQKTLAEKYNYSTDLYDFELSLLMLTEVIRRIDPELPILSLLAPMQCAQKAGMDLYYGTDTHWSEQGNKIAGQLLGQFMLDHWLDTGTAAQASVNDCVTAQATMPFKHNLQAERLAAFERDIAPLME